MKRILREPVGGVGAVAATQEQVFGTFQRTNRRRTETIEEAQNRIEDHKDRGEEAQETERQAHVSPSQPPSRNQNTRLKPTSNRSFSRPDNNLHGQQMMVFAFTYIIWHLLLHHCAFVKKRRTEIQTAVESSVRRTRVRNLARKKIAVVREKAKRPRGEQRHKTPCVTFGENPPRQKQFIRTPYHTCHSY
jgi:hypothetical protein